jgi:glucosamine-6-phosphate deaminase
MQIHVSPDRAALGATAGAHAADVLRRALAARGRARLIAATGTSQFECLDALLRERGIDWGRVELFHLDEYIGLPPAHPAGFRRYLHERLIEPAAIRNAHLIDADAADLAVVLQRLGHELAAAPVDLALTGIGENGHLAFNEPPADFTTGEPFLVVTLDEVSRRQQVAEGWFERLEDVPARAITMSIPQILRATELICLAPDARKAAAVRECLFGPVRAAAPASILQTHPRATVYLDESSASLVKPLLAASPQAPR